MSLPDLRQPLAAGLLVGALAARHLAQMWLTRGKVAGARSGWATTSLLFICYTGAMGLAVARVASGAAPPAAALGGFALWLAAIAFRMWALAHLAEQFSSLIEVRAGHRLVDTGPYSVVRHPLHLAFGLEVDALAAVAFSAWAAAPAVLVWVVIAVRNRTEEAALRTHLGAAYDEYAGRVPAMNVFVGLARRCRRGRERGGAEGA